MDSESLRALQAPIKARYRDEPGSSVFTLRAQGSLDGDGMTCKVATARGLAEAGLHPASGGDGLSLCSGDMLLEALVACARRDPTRRGDGSRHHRSEVARSWPRVSWISGGRLVSARRSRSVSDRSTSDSNSTPTRPTNNGRRCSSSPSDIA